MSIRVFAALCAALLVAAGANGALSQTSQTSQPQQQRAATGPLTLRQALQQVANGSPRLDIADRNIGMAEGRRQQANKLPNPTVGIEVDNFAPGNSENVGGAETTLMLSQLIELGGKRDARVSAALGGADAMRWEKDAARLELLSETTLAFVEALQVQRRMQILERQAATLEKLVP